ASSGESNSNSRIASEARELHCWINESCPLTHQANELGPPADCLFISLPSQSELSSNSAIQVSWRRQVFERLQPHIFRVTWRLMHSCVNFKSTIDSVKESTSNILELSVPEPMNQDAWGELYKHKIDNLPNDCKIIVSVVGVIKQEARTLVSPACQDQLLTGAGDKGSGIGI
ncbi:unnamed protein product, partial [Protopolystoma xenopodis]